MFAFAIWDARARTLLLARDRLGVKPLYYAQPADGFVFGSEIKAILEHPAVPRDLDEDAFADYLTFGFTPPPADDVPRHQQARARRADDRHRRRVEVRAADLVGPDAVDRGVDAVAEMGEAEMVAEVRRLLRESVREADDVRRAVRRVPLGWPRLVDERRAHGRAH